MDYCHNLHVSAACHESRLTLDYLGSKTSHLVTMTTGKLSDRQVPQFPYL